MELFVAIVWQIKAVNTVKAVKYQSFDVMTLSYMNIESGWYFQLLVDKGKFK